MTKREIEEIRRTIQQRIDREMDMYMKPLEPRKDYSDQTTDED
jgi:hypothetical protein